MLPNIIKITTYRYNKKGWEKISRENLGSPPQYKKSYSTPPTQMQKREIIDN